jgi:hypothetical protein
VKKERKNREEPGGRRKKTEGERDREKKKTKMSWEERRQRVSIT